MAQDRARNTVDVDVGGTFTDVVMVFEGSPRMLKVPTTPYDLSVCFMQAIDQAAAAVDLTREQLLPRIDLIRYSTTVAMNRLLERKGPRIGVITTEGHEDVLLIGRGAQWIDGTRLAERRALPLQRKPVPLVHRQMTVGVRERIDARGQVVRPLDEDDVRRKVRMLMDRGARALVVALLWSFANPEHELRVKEIIREEYRDYHIGYVPVILSHAVVSRLGEYERTNTSLLDAYLQRSMQIELSSMWDRLFDSGYTGPFMMVHNTGGCADVFRTTASRTYNGGPVAGLVGAHKIARELGFKNVVTSDVGGTSFDIGLVVDSDVRNYEFNPVIDRWMVAITMLQSLSIGAGGGSIAWLNDTLGGRVEVGPQSAGSYPGPACYGQGGNEATVTDADVVLGYINPDYYFGGRMKLDRSLAERALQRRIARPLGISVTEAAALIRRIVDEKMASAIRKEVVLRGYRPEEFVLFAFGGGGPTHAAGYAGEIPTTVVFPYSAVFCAFGSSIMDVMHVYEKSRRMVLVEPMTRKPMTDHEQFNATVRDLLEQARREMAGEGLPVDQAVFELELDMLYGGLIHSKRTSTPGLFMNSEADVWEFYKRFEKEFSEAFSPHVVNLPGGVYIDTFVLKASVPGQHLEMPVYELGDPSPEAARKGSRQAFWASLGGYVDTEVFDQAKLRPGHIVEGPALIEGEFTTVVVPPERRFRIGEHALGIMESSDARRTTDADSDAGREASLDQAGATQRG
jgi:N-methylhydantoinase A/oxoprolinase/acetone carboxylase beta subunit